MDQYRLNHIKRLENESVHILREVAEQFERPVLLFSAGKDSCALLRLAQKAFSPGAIPFPLMHVDTGFKFPEMYTFRDHTAQDVGCDLIVHRNEVAIRENTNPEALGTQKCCSLLKTKALVDGLTHNGFDAAIGGSRRDEERSRAKERIFSFRNRFGHWDPKNQRPEVWNLFNGEIGVDESIRVFPLSNWTELDVWIYIHLESIPIVQLYFAQERRVISFGDMLIPEEFAPRSLSAKAMSASCRFRTLGCSPCTGAVVSTARTVPEIIMEIAETQNSERSTRAIDHDTDGSMEKKKKEGYF